MTIEMTGMSKIAIARRDDGLLGSYPRIITTFTMPPGSDVDDIEFAFPPDAAYKLAMAILKLCGSVTVVEKGTGSR